ncbi:zinc finger, C3HC4 type, domain containing protein [Musa troglodytarum]|uniref:RING-type E3 ubiquitin transferase n=1 Tax=Musa troglodytarum TaxID=320322 RepID=A0A9E7FCX2_9LILI|nr:zinc finger, C3HC4 type, domain containing protein [Musa troglodytarum]
MDEYVSNRASRGETFARRGSDISFRDHSQEDRHVQNYRRSGCSSRVGSTRGPQIVTPERHKHVRSPFRSASGKAIAGSTSRSSSISGSHRKAFQEQHDQTFLQESVVQERSTRRQIDDINSNDRQVRPNNFDSEGRQARKEDPDSVSLTTKNRKSSLLKGVSTAKSKSSNGCSSASSSKVHKQISGQLVSGNQEASSSSFVPRSFAASRNSTRAAKSFSQVLDTESPRCGLQNLSCTSISDVCPSGCSSSDLTGDKRIVMVRKRQSDGESSAASGRGSNASPGGGYSGSTYSETFVPPHIPISGRITHRSVSRSRSQLTIRDGAVSVRTQRTSPGDNRMRPSEEGNGSTLALDDSTPTPQLQQTQFSVPEAVHESLTTAFTTDLPYAFNDSSGRPSSSNCVIRSRSVSRPESSSAPITHRSFGDRHGHRRLNMEGVAEVLLALERIERNEELTYEQLLVLETNILWGALRFHDQHRDMRMDIDNMSYEELLALEEKMGTVSTALTEEQMTKCLKRITYACASLVPGITSHDNDDAKCSICQEDYTDGEEVGRLPCEHLYHVACIDQWLRQKNWCPICKSSALPSKETAQN